jgi:hypothetical protein
MSEGAGAVSQSALEDGPALEDVPDGEAPDDEAIETAGEPAAPAEQAAVSAAIARIATQAPPRGRVRGMATA